MGMFGYEPQIGMKFDVEAAKKLLDEAGYKDRSKFPKVQIGFNTDDNHQRIAENVQAQIKKNLGIEVEIANEEWKVYLNRLKSDPPNIYRMGWIADYPDPDTFLRVMISQSDNNYAGWKNKTFDDLLDVAAGELDKAKRKATYIKAQTILIEDEVPVFPIYSQVYSLLISPRLKDFPVNALERIDLKGVTIQ